MKRFPGTVARKAEMKLAQAYKFLVEKPQGRENTRELEYIM
jgi:hypothetical protein